MAEIFAHCDRVTVLKDGRVVHDGPVAETTLPEVVRLMVGRAIEQGDWASHADPGATTLRLRDVTVGRLRVPELTVHRGEVVGVAGVLGAGQTELLERLAGVAHPATAGEVALGELRRLPASVAEAIEHGIFLVADDRLRKAIFRGLSVEENLLSGSLAKVTPGFVFRPRLAAGLARDVIARLRIKCGGPAQDVMQLSGGNQQKVVFGRWLARIGRLAERRTPPILLLDNPTEGVDVGSKAELYALIRDMAREGAAILIASAEFSELIALCDRVHCIADDSLKPCLPRAVLSEDRLLAEVN
jgi:ribose transport system ATP-binding protein